MLSSEIICFHSTICYIINIIYRRDKILRSIKIAYHFKKKKNLPIYGIKTKELREFTTTEKDLKRGISRIPLELSRLPDEDLVDNQNLATVLTEVNEESKTPINQYYYSGITRMTNNGLVEEQICDTEEMERLEEIIEQRHRIKYYNSSSG
jgi:hypothetical protein